MPSARLIALASLCLHYSILSLVMHHSRLVRDPDQPAYKASVAVVLTEFGKLASSLALARWNYRFWRTPPLQGAVESSRGHGEARRSDADGVMGNGWQKEGIREKGEEVLWSADDHEEVDWGSNGDAAGAWKEGGRNARHHQPPPFTSPEPLSAGFEAQEFADGGSGYRRMNASTRKGTDDWDLGENESPLRAAQQRSRPSPGQRKTSDQNMSTGGIGRGLPGGGGIVGGSIGAGAGAGTGTSRAVGHGRSTSVSLRHKVVSSSSANFATPTSPPSTSSFSQASSGPSSTTPTDTPLSKRTYDGSPRMEPIPGSPTLARTPSQSSSRHAHHQHSASMPPQSSAMSRASTYAFSQQSSANPAAPLLPSHHASSNGHDFEPLHPFVISVVRLSPTAVAPFVAREATLWLEIWKGVFGQDWWKLGIPAALFVMQNNLQYVAASNLSVPLFQVTYQLKILTTALCSVWLLNRTLTQRQWLSLFILALGVACVQLRAQSQNTHSVPAPTTTEDETIPALPSAAGTAESGRNPLFHQPSYGKDSDSLPSIPIKVPEMDQILGLTAVILACLSSGFASVYFERALKRGADKGVGQHQRDGYEQISRDSEDTRSLAGASAGLSHHVDVTPNGHRSSDSTPSGKGALHSHPPTPHISPSPRLGAVSVADAHQRRLIEQSASLWVRNVQLSIFGAVLGLLVVLAESNKDALTDPATWRHAASLLPNPFSHTSTGSGPLIEPDPLSSDPSLTDPNVGYQPSPFLEGFNAMAYGVVGLQVAGGLLAALVIKHADNIAKGFATSLSILISFGASMILFGFELSLQVVAGSTLVLAATWLYSV